MPYNPQEMEGIGGRRTLAARWRVEAALRTLTAMHLGGSDDGSAVDLPVLRDPRTGRPLLTGASLGGALREYLCSCLFADNVVEANGAVAALFGGVREDPAGRQSAAIVFDAVGHESDPEIRDGLAVSAHTGVAAKGAKYDFEVWPPGLTFPLRVDVLVPPDLDDEVGLIAHLARALEGFADGSLRLGMKTRRGLGVCEMTAVRARRYSLQTREQWLTWLKTGLEPERPLDGEAARPKEAVAAAWPARASAIAAAVDGIAPPSRLLTVDVPVSFPAGILIGAPQRQAFGADMAHIESGGQPVVTGTSLAGALRKQALRIARLCRGSDGDALVDELFGSPHVRVETDPRASRLVADELPLTGGRPLEITRIRIDRFTQAPVSGGLLQEQPWFGAAATLRVRVRLPADEGRANALRGLVMLLVKDVMLGDVPLGGTIGVGRGVPRLAGTVEVRDGERILRIPVDAPAIDADVKQINAWVRHFNSTRPPEVP